MTAPARPAIIHLESQRASVVLGFEHDSASILYWGPALPALGDEADLLAVLDDGQSWGEVDFPERPGVWREGAGGFLGAPTIAGHRSGLAWSPRFVVLDMQRDGQSVTVTANDEAAGLQVASRLTLDPSGVLFVSHALTNTGDTDYTVDAVTTWLPVPDRVTETLDFTGRWLKERQPQRRPIGVGVWSREEREGRTGHNATIVEIALTEGTTFSRGEAWAVGLMWSSNSRHLVERTPFGRTSMGAGELLLPGEVILAPGETYEAPAVAAACSDSGLDGVTAAYVDWQRSRPHHPTNIRPRPLTLNVWEAVWFDHDLGRLTDLMDVAQEIGIERFVLDDGWFHLRRDDHAGLGDWWVDPDVWPEGLGDLIARVQSRGMEFGLWFEPEMVNVDSDLYRAHPDWILHMDGRMPPEQRFQQVLDLTHPEAWQYLFDSMNALLSEYDIAYIKWDHNRVLIEPGHLGRAAVREQTLAFYRLVDALKAAHPGLEIESCSSGGGRIDLGVVEHADRFWTSDSNEALERQGIQRWTGMAVAPELLGTHIGPTTSHSTARTHSLGFRAVTALFGHAGIEWDITTTTPGEREHLREWADYYKANRALFHSGRVVRADDIDPAAVVYGVVAQDGSRAAYAYAQVATAGTSKPANLLLPGLDPAGVYRVRMQQFGEAARTLQGPQPSWAEGVELSGAVLAQAGLRPPRLFPENAVLIEVERNG